MKLLIIYEHYYLSATIFRMAKDPIYQLSALRRLLTIIHTPSTVYLIGYSSKQELLPRNLLIYLFQNVKVGIEVL